MNPSMAKTYSHVVTACLLALAVTAVMTSSDERHSSSNSDEKEKDSVEFDGDSDEKGKDSVEFDGDSDGKGKDSFEQCGNSDEKGKDAFKHYESCDKNFCSEAIEILELESQTAKDIFHSEKVPGVESKLFVFLNTRPRIKDLSAIALVKSIMLKQCKDKYKARSCYEWLEDVEDGDICEELDYLRCHCPFYVPNCAAQDDRYRTIDGTCNNKEHPLIGSAGRAYQRLLPPDYADCIGEPRSAAGELPSARVVSNVIYQSDVLPKSNVVTIMHMAYGQLLDHDTDVTPIAKLRDETTGELVDVECGVSGCETEGSGQRNCFPIKVPDNDPLFNKECLMFVRSEEVPLDDCSPSPRQQPNDITSWLDASFVYDSDDASATFLRTLSNGKLKSIPHPFNATFLPLLPQSPDKACRNTVGDIQCFLAGDRRRNEQVGLQALHTIFMRYHNYIAENLKIRHPDWQDETLYQQARRVLIAVWQMTVYNEYLPPLLGNKFMYSFSLNPQSSGYLMADDDELPDIDDVNPDTANAFATAAFRMGHSQIGDKLWFSDPGFNDKKEIFFSEVLFDPTRIYKSGILGNTVSGVNAVTIGQTAQPADALDNRVTKQMAGHLFTDNPPMGLGMDLPALNTQRGRDHGLPGYTRWRAWCNEVLDEYDLEEYKMKIPNDFDDLNDTIAQYKINKLKSVYNHVDDIDLFTGGLLEDHVSGGIVGATFACIIAKEFHNKKFGDRFYFETSNERVRFTEAQLDNIRNQTIASIFCKTLEDDPGNVNMELNFQKYVLLQTHVNAERALNNADISEEERDMKMSLFSGEPNNRKPCSEHTELHFNLF